MFALLGSIILATVVACLMGYAEQKFADKQLIEKTNSIDAEGPFKIRMMNLVKDGWTRAGVFGATVGVVNYLTPKLAILGVVLFLVMIALYIYLMYRWYDKGRTISGMLAFAVIAALIWPTMMATVTMLVGGLKVQGFSRALLLFVPTALMIAAIGFFVFDAFRFKSMMLAKEAERTKDDELAKRSNVFGWLSRAAVVVLALVLLTGTLSAAGFNLPSWPNAKAATPPPATASTGSSAKATAEKFYAFYNPPLSKNDDPKDDYNFGHNPRQYHPEWEKSPNAAKLFDEDFRNRMTGAEGKGADVALAAADMAWLDANVGTRYLGTFYESCKEDWALTMNEAKVKFMGNEKLYRETLEAYFKFLDSAVKVEVKEGSDLDDQMYMNPFTVDGIPDIVVFKTNDHNGLFLVYTFEIKGEKVEVAYRIDCGYQPTNVEKIMKITPQPKPTPKPTPKPDPEPTPTPKPDPEPTPTPKPDPEPTPTPKPDPEPTPTPKPDPEPTPTPKPDPEPTPTPEPKKDPTKGTKGDPTKPNDDTGPGPNTNNPENPNKSTEDVGPRSTDGTKEDYDQKTKELEDANKGTKTGGEPNTPTTTPQQVTDQLDLQPSTPVDVDNNADTGTSTSPPIDEPTPVQPPVENVTPDGGSTPITDQPGEPWGGPPD